MWLLFFPQSMLKVCPVQSQWGFGWVLGGSTTFPPNNFEDLNKRTLSPQQSMVSEVFSCSCLNSNFNSFWQFWNQNAGFRWYRHLYGNFFCICGQIFLFTTREKKTFVNKLLKSAWSHVPSENLNSEFSIFWIKVPEKWTKHHLWTILSDCDYFQNGNCRI